MCIDPPMLFHKSEWKKCDDSANTNSVASRADIQESTLDRLSNNRLRFRNHICQRTRICLFFGCWPDFQQLCIRFKWLIIGPRSKFWFLRFNRFQQLIISIDLSSIPLWTLFQTWTQYLARILPLIWMISHNKELRILRKSVMLPQHWMRLLHSQIQI